MVPALLLGSSKARDAPSEMEPMQPRKLLFARLGIAALLLTAALAVALPLAGAHACTAEDPEKSCGECREGVHEHRYNNWNNYCSSSELDSACKDALGAFTLDLANQNTIVSCNLLAVQVAHA
jgi:hypothetical protein